MRGLNCFWEMPFRGSCRMTLENRDVEPIVCYYQINYTLTDVPDDAAYFHAQFRRVNPLPYKASTPCSTASAAPASTSARIWRSA